MTSLPVLNCLLKSISGNICDWCGTVIENPNYLFLPSNLIQLYSQNDSSSFDKIMSSTQLNDPFALLKYTPDLLCENCVPSDVKELCQLNYILYTQNRKIVSIGCDSFQLIKSPMERVDLPEAKEFWNKYKLRIITKRIKDNPVLNENKNEIQKEGSRLLYKFKIKFNTGDSWDKFHGCVLIVGHQFPEGCFLFNNIETKDIKIEGTELVVVSKTILDHIEKGSFLFAAGCLFSLCTIGLSCIPYISHKSLEVDLISLKLVNSNIMSCNIHFEGLTILNDELIFKMKTEKYVRSHKVTKQLIHGLLSTHFNCEISYNKYNFQN